MPPPPSPPDLLNAATVSWVLPAPLPRPGSHTGTVSKSASYRPESILLRLPDEVLAHLMTAATENTLQGDSRVQAATTSTTASRGAHITIQSSRGCYLTLGKTKLDLDETTLSPTQERSVSPSYYRLPHHGPQAAPDADTIHRLALLPTPETRFVSSQKFTPVPSSSSSSTLSASSGIPSGSGPKTTDLAKATHRLKVMREADAERKRKNRAVLIDQSQFDARGRLLQGTPSSSRPTSRDRAGASETRSSSPALGLEGEVPLLVTTSSRSSNSSIINNNKKSVATSSLARSRSSLGIDASPLPSRSVSPAPLPFASSSSSLSRAHSYHPSSTSLSAYDEKEEDRGEQALPQHSQTSLGARPSSLSPNKTSNQTRARLARAVKGKGPKGEDLKKKQEKERRRIERTREDREGPQVIGQGRERESSSKGEGSTTVHPQTSEMEEEDRTNEPREERGTGGSKAAVKVRDMATKRTSEEVSGNTAKKPTKTRAANILPSASLSKTSSALSNEASESVPSPPKANKRKRDAEQASPDDTSAARSARPLKEISPSPDAKSADDRDKRSASSKSVASTRPPSFPPSKLQKTDSGRRSYFTPETVAQPLLSADVAAPPEPQPQSHHHGPSASASLATREPWLDIRGVKEWRHLVDRHARVLKQYHLDRLRLEEERDRLRQEREIARVEEEEEEARRNERRGHMPAEVEQMQVSEQEKQEREQGEEQERERERETGKTSAGMIDKPVGVRARADEVMKGGGGRVRAEPSSKEIAEDGEQLGSDGERGQVKTSSSSETRKNRLGDRSAVPGRDEAEEGEAEEGEAEEEEGALIDEGEGAEDDEAIHSSSGEGAHRLQATPSIALPISWRASTSFGVSSLSGKDSGEGATTAAGSRSPLRLTPAPAPVSPPPMDLSALTALIEVQRSREGELTRMILALDAFKKGWDGLEVGGEGGGDGRMT